MRKMCLMLMMLMAAGLVSAGTLTKGTTAPTDYFASGGIDAPNYTRVFADGARPTDDNEGRGNEIIGDSGSIAGYTMTALVIRKDGDGGNPPTETQDFTGTTATLTLYVFEGTEAMWNAGDGQGDGDLWDETGITRIYEEEFALNDSYAEGDYLIFALDTPIFMAADMGFFIKMDQGDSDQTFFQIKQYNYASGGDSDADGDQYQSKTNGNLSTGSPLEYYAIGELSVSPTGDAVDPLTDTATEITWDLPITYTPEVGYDLILRKATEDIEPNFLADDNIIEILDASASSPAAIPVELDYDSTYWCSLTAYEPNDVENDYTDDIPHTFVWSFSTIAKAVVLTPRYVTWPDKLSDDIVGTVVGFNPDDVASDTLDMFEITEGPGVAVNDDVLMEDRVAFLGFIDGDPNLLRDYIGTDCSNGVATSDVLTLTLSDLPLGSYTWTSYHYDVENLGGSAGVFDVTVTDSTGETTTTDVAQSAGASDPNIFETTITSNGLDDVTLQFVGYGEDQTPKRFMMNAFELTGSSNPLKIDFGPDPNHVMTDYEGYFGTSGDLESFDPSGVTFSAFGGTDNITVKTDWNAPGLEITGTPIEAFPTYTATVNATGAPKFSGPYTIEVKATVTETGLDPVEVSGKTTVRVTEDACEAAKFLGTDLKIGDVDKNCIVDLEDFAALAEDWLDNISLEVDDPATY